MSTENQLQPEITAQEIIAAFQLLYPTEFNNVATVIANAKRNALIQPEEQEDASDI